MGKDHLYEIIVFILLPFALASIFILIWSGASLLSLCCTIFSAYRKPVTKSASLYSPICGSPRTLSCRTFLTAVSSHLLDFSHFWYRPTVCRPPDTVKLEQRVEKCKSTGLAVRSPTLCSEVISYNTDWFDWRFPFLHFLFKLPPPKCCLELFFSPKCYKNANVTNATSNPLFDFFYGITMIFFFFNLEKDAGNFISLGFYFILWFCWKWVGPKVGFYTNAMWIISSLEADLLSHCVASSSLPEVQC